MITHYLDNDRGYIISREELRKDFDFMTDEERQEYNNNFDDYIKACMVWNNGALKPLTAEEYNKYTAMMNNNVTRC